MLTFQVLEHNLTDRTGQDKGFVNSLITAYQDDQEVGYLKISLLRGTDFDRLNPSWWEYMKNYRGWTSIKIGATLEENSQEILRYLGFWEGDIKSWSEEKRQEAIKKRSSEYLDYMARSRAFFADKPFVCFVEVQPDYRGQGIAQALYTKAAAVVKEWGLELYSDDNQTAGAKRVWEKLVNDGKAQSMGRRYKYLD